MGGFKNRLKAMQDNWQNNRESAPAIPAGIYTMQLQNAEIVESQSSGNMQIHREHLIIDGEYSGQVAHDYMQLETDRGPEFVARWVEQMGFEVPDDAAELEEVVSSIADAAPTYSAQIKISEGGFTNVRIKNILDEGEAPKTPSRNKPEDKGGFEVGEEVSFEDDDGDTLAGEITEIDGSEATVTVDDDEYVVDFSDLTPSDGGGGAPAGDEVLDQLIAFAQSQDLDVDEDDDEESIKEKILEYDWSKDELVDEEVALLESIGASFEEKPKPKKKIKPKKKPSSKKKAKPSKKKSRK